MAEQNFPEQASSDLNSFDPSVRRKAVEKVKPSLGSAGSIDHNMHCHTFFSYNGYGLSPSAVAAWAARNGLFAAAIIDFDVLDGADEFLHACSSLNLRGACGIETRAFIPELASKEINSPGEPGIAYHMGFGFASSSVPQDAKNFLDSLRDGAARRTHRIVECVNSFLSPVELDYDRDVLSLTPSGNATERHVCTAYADKSSEIFPDNAERVAFWASMLGLPKESADADVADRVRLEALIRAKTMKSGGPGYIKPEPQSFPSLKDMNSFIMACGAIPCVAWLNGESEGERDVEALLDLHQSYGAEMLNVIPDRNWNFKDASLKARKVAEIERILASCVKRDIPVIAGTEMNAPGQKLIDDFGSDALNPYIAQFVDGAATAFAHTLLAPFGMGLLSDWSKGSFKDKRARNDFFSTFGRKASPSFADELRGMDSKPSPERLLSLS